MEEINYRWYNSFPPNTRVTLNCRNILMFIVLLILFPYTYNPVLKGPVEIFPIEDHSPCCSYPCQNGGTCVEKGDSYECDCTGTRFYGRHCNKVIVNDVDYHFFPSSGNKYPSLANVYNSCIGVRILPPVPSCPTPLGNKGPKALPNVDDVFETLLARTEFKENDKSLNVLFAVFGQQLALQFKECNAVNWVTCSHVYSFNERTYNGGKLKVHKNKNEDYPFISRQHLGWITQNDKVDFDYLITHNTLTYLFSVIWLREHNSICDKLAAQWPAWNDEHIFQTARNIVTGELLVITLSEWLTNFSSDKLNLHYKPVDTYSLLVNTIPLEVYFAFHWPHMLPDEFKEEQLIDTKIRSLVQSLDPSQIYKHGLYYILRSLAKEHAGKAQNRNIGKGMSPVTKMLVEMGRKFKLPSLNQFRSFLGLKKYERFSEITNQLKLNYKLKELYGSVDGIEFVTGILIESSNEKTILGETSNRIIYNWLLKALLTHPLFSYKLWKPSVMGGQMGLDRITNANFQDLICRNVHKSSLCFQENLMNFKVKTEINPEKLAIDSGLENVLKSSKDQLEVSKTKTEKRKTKCILDKSYFNYFFPTQNRDCKTDVLN